jgi:hypothetical protein
MFRNAWPIVAASGLLLCAGCSDQDRYYGSPGPVGPQALGTLALSWTIDGSADPALCEAVGATDFEAVVSDGFGRLEMEAPCSDFSGIMTVYVGDYVARTRIVDATDYTVSRRVVLDRVRILEDQVTPLSIDFPSDFVAEPEEDAGAPPSEAEPDAAAPPDEGVPGDAGVPPDAATVDAAAP